MPDPRYLAGALLILGIAIPGPSPVAQTTPPDLPDPLTLEAALAQVSDEPHPDVVEPLAQVAAERARRRQTEAILDTEVELQGRLRWVQPNPQADNRERHDSALGVMARKRLYDFGLTEARTATRAHAEQAARLRYRSALQRRYLAVMDAFFAVLRADLRYRVADEAMAIAFVEWDNAQERHAVGEISDVDQLRAESRYQTLLSERASAQARQRLARAALAEALNRPNQLPGDLAEPTFPDWPERLPPLQALQETALDQNPRLLALRAGLKSRVEAIAAARQQGNPVLSAEARAFQYQRERGGRDDWQIGLQLRVPLYRGDRTQAAAAEAVAETRQLRARLRQVEQTVRQTVRGLRERYGIVQQRRAAAATRLEYRSLALDRSRSLYALEVRTDLGDALVEYTEARRQAFDAKADTFILVYELATLLGRTPSLDTTLGMPDLSPNTPDESRGPDSRPAVSDRDPR